MPELPEVENTVRALMPHLPGRRVIRTRLRYRSLYRRGSLTLGKLRGRVVDRVERVGKNAVIRFRPSGLMLVNLGMTGRLVVWPNGDAAERDRRHLHARVYLDDDTELRYYDARRFGHIYVAEQCDFVRDLGIAPDPFATRARDLQRTLAGRSASVKALLLAQHVISGIGNIYADETLFRAGVHPLVSGDAASVNAAVILRESRKVLRRAIRHGGSTIRDYRRADGRPGSYQMHHAVYGRAGKPCPKCSTPIRRIVAGGRGTHFCPTCQIGRR